MTRQTRSDCRWIRTCDAGGQAGCREKSAGAGSCRRTLSRGTGAPRKGRRQSRRALTLVEMLIAMAITLVMMAAVVTLFANVSNSVRNRRATIELSGQIRHVRNVLQQDLQGATCPGLTWQRPESNHGYIELIEGQFREGDASGLIDSDGISNLPSPTNPEIDHTLSIIPTSNLLDTSVPQRAGWVTDGGALGDYDDVLMLTVRNEHEPFVGRMPAGARPGPGQAASFSNWGHETTESPLAEVIWFAVENPGYTGDVNIDGEVVAFHGEPGMRTIYRRTLLIAPWLNPYRHIAPNGTVTDTFVFQGENFKAEPGLLRVLAIPRTAADQALAALVAFQDRYDISCRIEFDPYLGSDGRWKIMANSLADLTKRENRFGHYGLSVNGGNFSRQYPYAALSQGDGYSGNNAQLVFVYDPETIPPSDMPRAEANIVGGVVGSYTVNQANFANVDPDSVRPFAYVNSDTNIPATARAVLNDDGQVVQVLHGFVPLWGSRRGEDVMLTDVLGFDLRVYDPGAPLFGHTVTGTVLEPSDAGWAAAYLHADNMADDVGSGWIGQDSNEVPFAGQGAYVDLGYGYDTRSTTPNLPFPRFANNYASSTLPWFFRPRGIHHVVDDTLLTPGYAKYDTWSFHYENNGLNEDGDGLVDEGTNGLDSPGHYFNAATGVVDTDVRLGVDDVGERETAPPYDKPLRGVQFVIRAYERDSRQIRQVRVNQHFMHE